MAVMDADVAHVAGLLAEPARARMIAALMNGRSLPAGELAAAAGISAQTASNHLRKLLAAKMLRMQPSGRHRYYQLDGIGVATAFEGLGALATRRPKCDEQTARFRHCYSHMAGTIAVSITDALLERRIIAPDVPGKFRATTEGEVWFGELGVWDSKATSCIDWTERRPHLGGPLGVSLFHRFIELGWIAKTRDSRALRITPAGARNVEKLLGLRIPARFVN
jgi:DNA-binding transcriptional ArsR family regulator